MMPSRLPEPPVAAKGATAFCLPLAQGEACKPHLEVHGKF